MALALGESGARLALVGRNRDKLAETRKLAADIGAESEIFLADVRDEAQVGKLEKDVITRFGGTHILINNAGTAVRKNVADFSLDEWKLVVGTNLTGAFLVSRAFIPHMKKAKWGRIINMTSIMAHIGSTGRRSLLRLQGRSAGADQVPCAGACRRWHHGGGDQSRILRNRTDRTIARR